MDLKDLIDRLQANRTLTRDEFVALIARRTPESADYLAGLARAAAQEVYGTSVFPRGLIEFTNHCANNCLYCGIRAANGKVRRYRLSEEQILAACANGYQLGYRSFVLQGGEDRAFTDERMVAIVAEIHRRFPDCALTLSLGERSRESYQALFEAGAGRYLLRHEAINPELYRRLHPENMSLANRTRCLRDLREIGYYVGTGFMVGVPHQTIENLVEDLQFIERVQPQMVGIGPFVPHHDTPFRDSPSGTVELTTYLISILRLMNPHFLLPSTTSLGTIDPRGREKGILAGANVVMPNLSPVAVRKDYSLYDNKICTGEEAAECAGCLGRRMASIGYHLEFTTGDVK